jgi:hypothetical protein
MRQGGQQDPERRGFEVVRSHSPRLRLSAGRATLSRLPYGAPKARGLDRVARPAKNTKGSEKGEWELSLDSVARAKGKRNLRFLSPLESPFFPLSFRGITP